MDVIRVTHLVALVLALVSTARVVVAACPTGVDPKASTSLAAVTSTSGCAVKTSHSFSLPDAGCTPGAINPTVELSILKGGAFKTSCDRNVATSATKKNTTYAAYGLKKPANNTGLKQRCELDHLISLELGGADTLDNIWPQCGPPRMKLANRYFKIKDGVENYLAAKVKKGEIDLKDAQQGIAADWTQYISEATAYWSTHKMKGFGNDQ